ncbi:MAG: ribose 5-phosphate isomerase B [Lachnospiraceae bacterium]|nr:ribose 5-phosphate isomerase B [Lachnospiraceae bacterium]MBQ3401293.1 ribose 5-phosphate isomerase B [Lachnospiraceae bacterium]MBR0106598.1 ribose 5-phosphate isomerase B [Lachnospiraceae bacterium]
MKIAIANDHAATDLKKEIMGYLEEKGYEVVNFGTDGYESCHYPEYAEPAANAVASGECDLGILICGSGVGVSLCANKVNGIRCVVCSEPYSAQMSRRHNDTNMLAFGARVVGVDMAKMIVDAWLGAEFEGGRHQTRVDMMMDIERRNRCGTV